jgi:hypothetical protein
MKLRMSKGFTVLVADILEIQHDIDLAGSMQGA